MRRGASWLPNTHIDSAFLTVAKADCQSAYIWLRFAPIPREPKIKDKELQRS